MENPKEVLSEGQEVTARVLEVNPVERRIRLSLRPANEEPVRRAPREEFHDQPAMGGAPAKRSEDRPRRRRSEGGDRRRQESANSQLPQEEMNFSIGDLLKQREMEDGE